jgi:4-hydroxyproline epimerase
MTEIEFIDSHTGGEPTRTLVAGGPDLGSGPMRERLEIFRNRFDHIRAAAVNEPRGSDVLVGALLVPPNGVVFFNNVGYLGMCGHGAIGVMATLQYLGRIGPGRHVLETPVGAVTATLHEDGRVSIGNVASYRQTKDLTVEVEGLGRVSGDVAWGGNWFYIVNEHGEDLRLENVERLTEVSWRIRQAVNAVAPQVDHIELCSGSRNFVLCPGKAYDRSPCGTGTSAKVACLAADGKLAPGEVWRQESIVGSVFEATYELAGGEIRPTITGRAWISARGTLLLDPSDPFVHGIR